MFISHLPSEWTKSILCIKQKNSDWFGFKTFLIGQFFRGSIVEANIVLVLKEHTLRLQPVN